MGNDRRVSPAEEAAITCAVVPEAKEHRRARASDLESRAKRRKDRAEDLVKRTPRVVQPVSDGPVKSLLP